MYRKAVREDAISEENPSSSGRMVLRYYSSTSHDARLASPSGFPFVGEPLRNFSAGWRLVFMQMALCNTFSRCSKIRKHLSLSLLLFFLSPSLYYYTVIFVSLIFVSFIYIGTIISFFFRSSSNVPSVL